MLWRDGMGSGRNGVGSGVSEVFAGCLSFNCCRGRRILGDAVDEPASGINE